MKTVSLSGSPRENVGKKDAKGLRAAGRVPCVLYGGAEQSHFSVNLLELSKYVYTADVFQFKFDVGGKKAHAVMKDLQFDPVSDRITHVDFMEVVDGKPLKIDLPVQVTGNAIGVRNGGRLNVNFRRLKVQGLAVDFPEAIIVDITKLRIGMSLRVKDLSFPKIKFMHAEEAIVIAVKTARGAMDALDEAEEGEETAAAAPAEGAPAETAA